MRIDYQDLLPQLVHRDGPLAHPGSNLASINLSPGLQARLMAHGRELTMEDILRLQLPLRAAWTVAVENLMVPALHDGRIVCPSRRLPGCGVQIGLSPHWLAHPQSFGVIHHHATALLGEPPVYLTPRPDCLYAVSPKYYPDFATSLPIGEDTRRIDYHHGYPWLGKEWTTSAAAAPQALSGVSWSPSLGGGGLH